MTALSELSELSEFVRVCPSLSEFVRVSKLFFKQQTIKQYRKSPLEKTAVSLPQKFKLHPMKSITHNDYTQRINKVAEYINRHLDEPIELKTLADIATCRTFTFVGFSKC